MIPKPHRFSFSGPRGPWLEHLIEDEGLTMQQAVIVMKPFELIPIIDPVQGHMGTLAKLKKEVHLAVYRKHRAKAQCTRDRVRQTLQPLLDKEVFLVTKVDKPADARFVQRLGFQRLGGTIGGITTFILNDLAGHGESHAQLRSRLRAHS